MADQPDRGEAGSSAEDQIKQELARELHDQVAPVLTSMLIQMEEFKGEQVGRASVLREVDALQVSTREVLQNIRQLLYDLRGRPGVAEDFPQAIQAGLLKTFAASTGIQVEMAVRPGWPSRISAPASLNLYRIIQEALNNVRLHSGATRVDVVLDVDAERRLLVTVSDNGRGVPGQDDAAGEGMGRLGMRERALLLGGRLTFASESGRGTVVTAVFPREQVV